jgi:hypothetical protein
MNNLQVYLAIGVPVLFNFGIVLAFFLLLNGNINSRLDALEHRFDDKFAAINRRFDDMRDLWRAELHRVEEVLDARLKHLEER